MTLGRGLYCLGLEQIKLAKRNSVAASVKSETNVLYDYMIVCLKCIRVERGVLKNRIALPVRTTLHIPQCINVM